jgi:hypothetical protein
MTKAYAHHTGLPHIHHQSGTYAFDWLDGALILCAMLIGVAVVKSINKLRKTSRKTKRDTDPNSP